MLRKGEAAVRTALKGVPKDSLGIDDQTLFRLSEERGLNPEMVVSIAAALGWNNLSVRVGFAADMAARNAKMTKAAAKARKQAEIFDLGGLNQTSADYYNDTSSTKFSAEVLRCIEVSKEQLQALSLTGEVEGSPSHAIILDRTLFYPEGGGQLGDQGAISQGRVRASVLDTRSQNGIIIHLTDTELSVGPSEGEIDWTRRKQLMDHHTAIHIVGGASRELLGPHVWQAGSSKGAQYARLDITHFSRLSREQLDEIEDRANDVVNSNPRIEKIVLDRSDADSRFGFEIYQGGPPKHQEIRIIKIDDFDTQACGGTHHDEAGQVGELRIIRSSQVQDGVERLQVVAGETAREHARSQERLLNESSEVLGVSPDDLPGSVARFFEEWKSQKKKIESLEAEIIRLRTSGGGDEAVLKDGVSYVVMEIDPDTNPMSMLKNLTLDQTNPTLAILGTRDGGGKLIVACTEGTIAAERHDATEILRAIASHIEGGGGGRPTMAQGGGSKPDGIPAALDAARELLGL